MPETHPRGVDGVRRGGGVGSRGINLSEGPLEGGKVVFLKDPDGIRIELLQADLSLPDAVLSDAASG